MMDTFFILATEAHGAERGLFGINTNLFETNLINLAIFVGVLVYFGKKVLIDLLNERREKIAQAVQEAQEQQQKAAAALAQEEKNLAQAQAEAERIRQEAEQRAKEAQAAIASQSEKDIQRLKDMASQDLNSRQEAAIAELRRRVTAMALERAESRLTSQLDESSQQAIINRSIAELGGGA